MWAEASTPQTTSFPGRLTEVRSTGGRVHNWADFLGVTNDNDDDDDEPYHN